MVLIETCEESGSYDLPYYVDHLADRIGKPSLVVCLDSGCANYDQLWLTTSLRGLAGGNLIVKVLQEGVHSGDASGVVASSFRILRTLLSRLEDQASGRILPQDLYVEIPPQRLEQAKQAVKTLGTTVYDKFPFVEGMRPMSEDLAELVLNRTWRPALSVTGLDGMPPLTSAGNVLRPFTAVKLSLRLPPTLDAANAGKVLKNLLEKDPPYGAKVTFEVEKASAGWNAPAALALARSLGRRRLAGVLRPAPRLHGRGRHHPLHGHARREIPRRPVPHHRRPRPRLQRPRPQRVPAHPHGQARLRLRRPRGGRSLPGQPHRG